MLYLIAWLTDCALILFVFSSTRVLADAQADAMTLGTLGAAFFLASAISNAVSGRLSDRIGRRIVAISGAGCLVVSLSVVVVFDQGGWAFYVAYTCVGLSVGQVYPPVISLLSLGSGHRSASRRFLLFGLAFNCGILCGQVGGGWLYDNIDHRAPLLVAVALAVVTLLCLLSFHEPDPGTDDNVGSAPVPESDRASARCFTQLAWLANFAGMFSMSTLWFLFPKLAVALKIPADNHGVVLGVGRATVMAVYILMHVATEWQHRFRFSVIVQLLGLLGMVLVYVSSTAVALATGVVLLSLLLGYNYFASLFYNREANDDRQKGKAFGLNEAFLGLGAAGGALLGGWAASDWGERAPFQMSAVLIAVSLVVQLAWFTSQRRSPKEASTTGDHG
ncbi:MAG: hypothetical protein CMJ65_05835 [Planctomycetaceae bacterium]|jgi:MFS family permease|nr:hypothetical protein [Planctomycetaceae bacterium]MDP7274920.1 MFS transporter [Planctomycetaceae bacterium]